MYELKTLLPQFDINIPKCMYEMKNMSLSANAAANVSGAAAARNNFNVSISFVIHIAQTNFFYFNKLV